MADLSISTPVSDPITVLRAALEQHFADMGVTVDFDAPLPEPAEAA